MMVLWYSDIVALWDCMVYWYYGIIPATSGKRGGGVGAACGYIYIYIYIYIYCTPVVRVTALLGARHKKSQSSTIIGYEHERESARPQTGE